MKGYIFIFLLMASLPGWADTLTLEEVTQQVLSNTGMENYEADYAQIHKIHQEIYDTYHLPMVRLSGQYTYQSDVVAFPDNPMFSGPEIPKNQGRLLLEINQTIYNGGQTQIRKSKQDIYTDLQKLEWELNEDQVVEAVADLYNSIVLLQKQFDLLPESNKEIIRQRDVLKSSAEYGVVSTLDLHRIDLLVSEREIKSTELNNTLKSLVALLEEWSGLSITPEEFAYPRIPFPKAVNTGLAETKRLDLLIESSLLDNQLRDSEMKPSISAFGQVGVGQPNPFNFFDTSLSEFYLVGIRLNWNILNYGRIKNTMKVTDIQNNLLLQKKDNVLEAKSRELVRLQSEMEGIQALINQDDELIGMQEEIVQISRVQASEGVITTADYAEELDKLTRLQIRKKVREIEIDKIHIKAQLVAGKL